MTKQRKGKETEQVVKCPRCNRRVREVEKTKPGRLTIATYRPCGHEWIVMS